MNQHRFVNRSQPQTLYMAVILCYIDVVFNLLGGLPALTLIGLVLAAGAYGIANEKKWGYALAVAAAVLQVVIFVAYGGLSAIGNVDVLISFGFDVALVALLLHPMSRDYERIWFK